MEEWMYQLRVKLIDYGFSKEDAGNYGSEDDWYPYFKAGYTPVEAIEEEFSGW